MGKVLKPTRLAAVCGILTALAAALSLLERAIPVELWIPLPGVKLGLANLVTLVGLYWLGWRPALFIVVARCVLGGFFFGGVTGFLFSITGGLLSLGVMLLLMNHQHVSLWGVSMAGAATHNIGQICIAMLLVKSVAPLAYLTVLLISGLVTGSLTAIGEKCHTPGLMVMTVPLGT